MKILHLSPYLPALDENHAGGICMGKQVETLSKEHQVYVVSFIITKLDQKIAESLSTEQYYCFTLNRFHKAFNVITHLWLPAYFATRSHRGVKKVIIKLIKEKQIEAVHAEYAAMGQYIWLKKKFPGLIFNLVEHDFTEQSYERKMNYETNKLKLLYYKSQMKLVHFWEKRYCTKADQLFVFNEKDKKLIGERYEINNIQVLNPYFGMEYSDALDERPYKKYRICFVGQMGRSENYEAAFRLIDIVRKLKKEVPELELAIIGNGPPDELCKKQGNGVFINGFVPDIDKEIRTCQLGVFPLLKGAGIKLKVLKCLSLGVPVVTTLVGAEGIDEEGTILSIAESDNEFCIKIKKIIDDDKEYKALSQRGKRFVCEKFGWEKTENILKQVYKHD